MKVREIRLRATKPDERGVELVRLVGLDAMAVLKRYRSAYRAFGIPHRVAAQVAAESLAALQDWDPAQAKKLEEFAPTMEMPTAALMHLQARAEILAHARPEAAECSTVVALHPDRAPTTIQTWDWYSELAPAGALLGFTTDAGVGVCTFSELGGAGEDRRQRCWHWPALQYPASRERCGRHSTQG